MRCVQMSDYHRIERASLRARFPDLGVGLLPLAQSGALFIVRDNRPLRPIAQQIRRAEIDRLGDEAETIRLVSTSAAAAQAQQHQRRPRGFQHSGPPWPVGGF